MTENTEQYWEQAWSREEMERLHSLLRERPFDKQEVLEQFQRNRGKKLCDVDCGFGFYASHFARAGFAVSGIDIAASSVQLTRQLLREQGLQPGEFAAAPATDIPFADRSFDAVFCNSVVDHMTLTEAERAIGEMERIAAPGGLIYLSFDLLDEDDWALPHDLLPDGSLRYTQGRREGMVLHPHSLQTVQKLLAGKNNIFLREHAGQVEALYQKEEL